MTGRGVTSSPAWRAVLTHAEEVPMPVSVVPVPAPELDATTAELARIPGSRLADFFAAGTDPVMLRLVWALDQDRRYLITETPAAGPEYPELADVTPAIFAEQCEIYEQFGIRPAGGKPLNRVAMPPLTDIVLPTLGRRPAEPPRDIHAPHTVGGQAFEFPFGPVRQAGVESLYYGLVTSGEELVDLYLFTWHKHRGIELRAQGRTPQDALFHIERAEGLGAVGNASAFAAAAEAAMELEVSETGVVSRAIALELERLYNHAAAIAGMCQACGLAVGRAAAEIVLEQLLRLNAAVFGHRYLFGVVAVGGARAVPDTAALRSGLPAAWDEFRRTCDELLATNSLLDRLEASGILTTADSVRLGLVGPVARASGVAIDARADHLSRPYTGLGVAVAAGGPGDALSRLRVMLAEAAESVRLIGELLASFDAAAGAPGAAGCASSGQASLGPGSGLGWAESARGESLAWIDLDASGRIRRLRLRPAAVRNWRGFDDACRSQNVFTDIPIIEASFWLTVAGTAR